MNAEVTVTIKGSPADIHQAIRTLLDTWSGGGGEVQPGNTVAAVAVVQGDDIDQTPWTPEQVAHVWGVIADKAKEALATIAKYSLKHVPHGEDGIRNSKLYEELGVDGKTLGGRLSSVGAAVSRLRYYDPERKVGKDWLWTYMGGYYAMKPEIAHIIRALWERDQGSDA